MPENSGMRGTVVTLDDSRRIAEIRSSWQLMQIRWAKYFEAAYRNAKYIAGDMLDEKVRATLEENNRPIFEFMQLQPYVVFLAGKLRRDGTRMKAVPVNSDDVEGAALRTKLISDWSMGRCGGYTEMARAALEAAMYGWGWVNVHPSWVDDPEGKLLVERLDPFSVMFDPDGTKLDGSDWRYLAFSKMYTADEIITIHADYVDEDTKARIREQARTLEGAPPDSSPKPMGWASRIARSFTTMFRTGAAMDTQTGRLNDFIDAANGMYRVIEWHDRRYERVKYVHSPITRDGEAIPAEHLDNQEYITAAMSRHPEAVIVEDVQPKLYVSACAPGLLPDKLLFEEPYKVQGKGYRIKGIPCFNFHPDTTVTGNIINPLIAPVDYFNQRSMTMVQLILQAIHPDILYQEGMIDEKMLPEWQSKAIGRMLRHNGGQGNEPKPMRPDGGIFQVIQGLIEHDEGLMERLSGFSPNMRGAQESSGESGALFQKRVAVGEVMISHFFDNVAEAQKGIFNYASALLPTFMSFPRELMVLGDNNDPQFFRVNWPTLNGMLNDVSRGDYDFVPDVQAIGETARQENLILLMQVLKLVPPELILWPEVFRCMDFPSAAKFAAYIEQQMGVMQQQRAENMQAADAMRKLQVIHAALQTGAAGGDAGASAQEQAGQRRALMAGQTAGQFAGQ